jgi:UDP-N-acetylmuramoylalanine--D-glutamate ligase
MPLIVSQLKDKNIIVLGAGLSGLSCARFLQNNALPFTVIDSRKNPLNLSTSSDLSLSSELAFSQQYSLGKLITASWHSDLIKHADVIITSPGIDMSVSEIADYVSQDCQLLGDVELYCQVNNQDTQTPILAVTGSNGKSTVVSLLAFLGQALGFNTQLGGNIGLPVLDQLASDTDLERNAIEFLVIELSSFQLETLNSMQAVAATILNISDDHLDRHKTLENYQKLKQKIYPQSDIAVINRDDSLTQVTPREEHQTIISFGSDEPSTGHFGLKWIDKKQQLMFGEQVLIAVTDLPLTGVHNALNCLAALALGMSAGWPLIAMVNQLPHFVGLAHRCQKVASNDKINWINDSKATNVGATLAAIEGLSVGINHIDGSAKKLILIVGGDGKGADFSPLKTAFTQHVTSMITLGKDGDKFKQLSDEITDHVIDTYSVATMEQAVCKARSIASEGDTVLLSPACASIDMFKNYIERGNTFIRAVQAEERLTIKETF